MTLEPEDIPFLGKLTDDVCLSGGAIGADVTWGNNALKAGHQVVHWSFEGHKSHDLEHTIILDGDELEEANEYLREANQTLKRRLNFDKKHIINLLRRNWYQVKYADSVYIVGSLNEKANIYDPNKAHDQKYHLINDRKDRLGVNGGTAWACQMYLDRYRREKGEMKFFMFIFDQIKRSMFVYSAARGCWMPLRMTPYGAESYKPTGIYAAIGSRDLNEHGKTFIEKIYNR